MDKFDDIWRNKFNDEDISIGDWNTPDDEQVWAGIVPHIPEKNGSRKGFLWWIFSLILLTTISLTFIFLGAKNNSGSNEQFMDSTNQEAIESQTTNAKTSKKTAISFLQSADQDNRSIEVEAQGEQNRSDSGFNINSGVNRTNKALNRIEQNILNQPAINDDMSVNEGLSSTMISDNEVSLSKAINTVNENNEGVFASSILPYGQLNFIDIVKKENIDIVLPEDYSVEQHKSNAVIAWGVHAGVVIWQHNISSSYINALSPFDFNYDDGRGWIVEGRMNLQLNDYIQPYVGIQYESVTVRSGHNSAVDYQLENEEIQGSMEGFQGVATPYGSSEVTYRLDRNESAITENTPLSIDINSNHDIRNWSVPVGLQVFPLGQSSKWQWATNIGFGTNYLQNISSHLSNVQTNHDDIVYNDAVPRQYDIVEIDQWHFDLRMGTGLQYSWKNNTSFNLNYQWSKGLNPVFQQGNYDTFINRHNITLGLLCQF